MTIVWLRGLNFDFLLLDDEDLVARDDFIAPPSRRQEVRNFVARGLRDFSISRANVSWGPNTRPRHLCSCVGFHILGEYQT